MSNIIPPMLSSSPPPMDDSLDDNDDDDEFGDFAVANLSFDMPDSSRPHPQSSFTWNADSNSSTPSKESVNKETADNGGKVENCAVEDDKAATVENAVTDNIEETQKVDSAAVLTGDNNGMGTESIQDNISQDSLVSGATDSGLCSASQNSGDASPVLHVEDDPLQMFPQSDLGFKRDESSDSDQTLGNSVFENSVERTFSDLHTVKSCSDASAVNDNIKVANSSDNLPPYEEKDPSTSSCKEIDEKEDNVVTSDCSKFDSFGDFSEFQLGTEKPVTEGNDSEPSVSRNINEVVNISETLKDDVCDSSSAQTKMSEEEEEDDFGNFESVSVPLDNEIAFSSNSKEDFSSSCSFVQSQPELETNFKTYDDSAQIPEQDISQGKDLHSAKTEGNQEQFDDEFEDFEMAQVTTEHFGNSADSSLVFSKVQDIVKSLFPYSNEVAVENSVVALSDYLSDNSKIWVALRDIELSHALTYQWAGSSSNKAILSALGIDSRNMLFGPRWNASVPRFAANLGFSPLEPVRTLEIVSQPATILKPEVETKPETSISSIEEPVPAAQFDWTSSGLVNPLDSLEKNARRTEGIKTDGQRLVQELLSAKGSTLPAKPHRPDNLSAEAVAILDSIPNLSFLQSKLLMFPVRESPQEIPGKSFGSLALD